MASSEMSELPDESPCLKTAEASLDLSTKLANLPTIKEISGLQDALQANVWYKLKITEELQAGLIERVGHSLIYNQDTNKIYMIGGGNHSGDLKEIWMFDCPSTASSSPMHGTLNEELSEQFPGLYEFSCAKDNGVLWIFGGATSEENKNDVFRLDLEGEDMSLYSVGKSAPEDGSSSSNSQVPVPRTQGNNSCFLSIKGEDYLAVFGGGQRGECAVPDGNLYLFGIKSKTWQRLDVHGMTPTPAQGHAMASIGTQVYIHGGMDQFVFSDDLYVIELDQEKPKWCKLEMTGPRPSARAAHGIIALNNCLYVCSGVGDEGALVDVWKFHTEAKEWTCLNNPALENTMIGQYPAPRTDFAMTLLQVHQGSGSEDDKKIERNMLMIHGGMNTQGTLFKDFWIFPLST